MQNLPFIIAIAALLCIIPTLIVYTVLHSKNLELKRAIDKVGDGIQAFQTIDARTIEHREQIAKLNVKVESLDESFRALNGKMTSRIRWEEKRDKRQKVADEEEGEQGQIPVEQQQLPFTFPPVPGNGVPITQQQRRRFGELP